MTRADQAWWKAPAGEVHRRLIPYVKTIEQRQSRYLDSFVMHEAHYDPNGPAAEMASLGYQRQLRGIKENVVAVCVDTVTAALAATEIRARFMTDGGDWSTQRRAMLLEQYAEEMTTRLKIGKACRAAFFACAKKGTGVVRVYADQDKQIRVEPWMVDNILVDDRECANGTAPRQIHFRQPDFDCDELCQQFPEHEEAIMKARGATVTGWRASRLALGESRNDVLLIESIRRPLGVKPDGWEDMSAKERKASGYVPGCHAYCVSGADLLVEEWHKPHFGIAEIRYFEREGNWYGGSLVERILPTQRVLNRRRDQQDRQLDLAVPIHYIDPIDAKIAIQQTAAGSFVPIKGQRPTTVVPTVIGAEIMNQIMDARASAIAEIGLNDTMTRGVKQPGLESGAALREAKDQGSQRFAMPEKAFECLWLDTVVLVLDVCKDLGDDAPKLTKQSRFGPREVPWSDVEITDAQVQIAAASTLARTPAGRVQTVLELTQAGALNVDELRKLLDHPDLKRTNSLYTSSMEAIEHDFEHIKEGYFVLPEPFVNLDMAQTYAQQEYLVERENGAPESVLEGLRAYAVNAADLLSRPAANANVPMDPTMGGAPPIGGALPPGTPPPGMDGAMPLAPPMPVPQQVPSAAPPTIPAGTGPMAA